MGKELPYFQFEPAQYLTGSIQFCSLEAQGLFTNVKAIYWQRGCELTIDQINKKYQRPELLEELIKENILKQKGDKIKINFLYKQFSDIHKSKKVNSTNGLKGAEKRWRKDGEANGEKMATPSKTDGIKIRGEKKREDNTKVKKIPFALSAIFDKVKFAEAFPGWPKLKLKHYYEAADRYSTEGNKYIDWKKAIEGWASKDDMRGELKFAALSIVKTETLVERQARLTAENHP